MEQYEVIYISGHKRTAEFIPAKFSDVRDMARRVVDNGTVERIEVKDSDGQVVFRA